MGFAFPEIDAEGVVVEVKLSYDSDSMSFCYCCNPVKRNEFANKLVNAISSNIKTLEACEESNCCENLGYVVTLNKSELSKLGRNSKQCRTAHLGVLCQAQVNGITWCFKKPILHWQISRLSYLSAKPSNNMSRH